jgi:hypothetical protein
VALLCFNVFSHAPFGAAIQRSKEGALNNCEGELQGETNGSENTAAPLGVNRRWRWQSLSEKRAQTCLV